MNRNEQGKSIGEQRLAGELVNVDNLSLSGHALSQFMTRTGVSLELAGDQIRQRLANSRQILNHPNIRLGKGVKFGRAAGIYFQDHQDSNLVYVLKKGKKKDSYVLATAISPMKITKRTK